VSDVHADCKENHAWLEALPNRRVEEDPYSVLLVPGDLATSKRVDIYTFAAI
jgi:hypothetical protein